MNFMPELDFDGPLERLGLDALNRSVSYYINRDNGETLNLNAEYQRGSIWDEQRQRNLVRSVLLEIPIGAIVINRRPDVMEDYVVIDGKQRIEALRAFADSKFPIPSTWLRPDFIDQTEEVLGWPVPGIRYANTTLTFKRIFGQRGMSSVEAMVTTVAAEAEIFRLINSGGIVQTEETLAAAAAIEGVNATDDVRAAFVRGASIDPVAVAGAAGISAERARELGF